MAKERGENIVNLKKATDEQIYKAYEEAFKMRNENISYQLAYLVIKKEFDRRKLDYEKVNV